MKALHFPFICMPDAALWQRIGSHAKCLFGALLSYRNRKTGMCNPKLTTLAERLGQSTRTIQRALAQLVRAGMVLVNRTLFGNAYQLATPDRWQTTISVTECDDKSGASARAIRDVTHAPPVASEEPDVFNHIEEEPDAVAAVLDTPGQKAAAAATTFAKWKTEKPTPPAPGVSAAAVDPQAETEKGNFPKNFPGNFFSTRETAEALVAELMPLHPQPGNLPGAITAAAQILASKPDEVQATVEAIRASHAAWRQEWPNRRFVPMLPKWFADGDWRNPPAERKTVQRETYVERVKREQKESDEETYRSYAELGAWDILREYMGPEGVEEWRARIEAETAA